MYENDSGATCDFEPASQQDVAEAVAYLATVTTGIGIEKIIKNGSFGNWAFTIASAFIGIAAYWHATAGDDFVGLVTVPRGSTLP